MALSGTYRLMNNEVSRKGKDVNKAFADFNKRPVPLPHTKGIKKGKKK